jgi:hypothetical protein
VHWCCVGEDRVRGVVLVKRFKDDDLVTGVDGRHHRGDHTFRRAAGDGDLGFGIDIESEEPARLFGDGVAKALYAPGDRVLIVVGGDGLGGLLLDVGGGGPIGEALAEIDGAVFDRLAAHLANNGFSERGGFARNAVLRDGRLHRRLIYHEER